MRKREKLHHHYLISMVCTLIEHTSLPLNQSACEKSLSYGKKLFGTLITKVIFSVNILFCRPKQMA